MRRLTALMTALICASALSAPVPKEMRPKDGLIALWGKGKPTLLRPDGKVYRDLSHKDYGKEGDIAPSPDGKRVALLVRQPDARITLGQFASVHKLYVRGVDEKGPGTELSSAGLTFRDRLLWSPDGKRIYAESGPLLSDLRKAAAAGKALSWGRDRTVVFDVAAKKWSSVPLPRGHSLIGERPDGLLLTTGTVGTRWHWFMTTADGKVDTKLDVDLTHLAGNDQLSPDGKRVLSVVWDEARKAARLAVIDLGTKKIKRLTIGGLPEKAYFIERARWSPDGKKIAFYYLTLIDNGEDHFSRWERSEKATLCVCGADGKGMKAIRKDNAERFHYFEWK
jgi:hypothetical protein